MQASGRGPIRPPIGIALDGDFGNRVDAVLAIAMLNGLATKGEARRIALCTSRTSLKGAQVADAVSGFFAGRAPAPRGGAGADPPGMVGVPEGGAPDNMPPLAVPLSKRGADGVAPYGSALTQLRDTAETAVLVRNVLLAQFDGNAVVVLAGPATGLARLPGLYGARPQIAAKARELVVALGAYPSGPADSSIAADPDAARRLFAEWPTPIVAVGSEVGTSLAYPGASIDRDFAWAPAHPVVDIYRAVRPAPHDEPASALAAVLYAVHPDAPCFKLSEPGTIAVAADGRTQFTAGAGGRHRYLTVDAAQAERTVKLFTELVSAPPVPRPGRRGGAD